MTPRTGQSSNRLVVGMLVALLAVMGGGLVALVLELARAFLIRHRRRPHV